MSISYFWNKIEIFNLTIQRRCIIVIMDVVIRNVKKAKAFLKFCFCLKIHVGKDYLRFKLIP